MTIGSESRRRLVSRAPDSSDLTRSRGWLLAAVLGALAGFFVLLARDGPRSLGAPGPLARPHAALDCASCHASRAEPAASRCTSCHGAHASTRPAHRKLAAGGALGCQNCHAVHQGEDGVAFEPGGRVSVYGTGFERNVRLGSTAAALPPGSARFVPLVRGQACARCHDASDALDPAAHCLRDDGAFSLCFDEHRAPAESHAGLPAERDAAVETARRVARALGPNEAAVAGLGANAVCVAAGLGVAGLVIAFERRRRRAAPASRTIATPSPTSRRLPVIDGTTCLGCHACVDACPYDALSVRRYVAVLERPDACCGAGPCQESCPNGSLRLVDGGVASAGPRLDPTLEALDRPGIFVAGDATGGSLVRNALRQGTAAAHAAATRVERMGPLREGRAALDLVIVGAGPAGLAAALTAQALGLRVLVLEQARFAASIQSFSRNKLVLDAPSATDEVLPLFVGDVKKEELVQRWQRTIRSARVPIREGARVLEVVPNDYGFFVRGELARGTKFEEHASTVLVATGTRGTPRELDVEVSETARAHVHYELSDARAFAGRRVVVVGLGDVAMESALALAAQPDTDVTVLYHGTGFRRGKRRNIDSLSVLVAAGKVTLVFEASVARITEHTVVARIGTVTRSFPSDAVFVHVGRIPSGELLVQAGVCQPNAARLSERSWDLAQHDKPSS